MIKLRDIMCYIGWHKWSYSGETITDIRGMQSYSVNQVSARERQCLHCPCKQREVWKIRNSMSCPTRELEWENMD